MDSACGYDAEKYAELLLRAMATILQPAGLDQAQIEQRITRTQAQPLAWQISLEWFAPLNQRDFSNAG
jgi:ferritin-like metal-binding protein YciE